MADLEFNKKDIEGLAAKLANHWGDFSEQERELLLAIFASAAGHVKPPGPKQPATLPAAANSAAPPAGAADHEATLANFRQQLLTAYIAGNSFDSITDGGDTGKIA